MNKIDIPTAITLSRIDAIETIMVEHGGDKIKQRLNELFREIFNKKVDSGIVLPAGERIKNESSSN